MLTAQSIEKIRQVAISSVIQHFVPLKKKGVNYYSCCPFHDEKTPSFVVSDSKEIYKCFGCGCSGDVIQFVIEHEKQTFYEACKTIATIACIELEYEAIELSQKEKEKLSAAEAQEQVLNFVVPLYQQKLHELTSNHPVKQWLCERGVNEEIIAQWQLGWATDDWNFITPKLINKGWYEPANKLGIIKRRNDNNYNNYDGYRSRIIFPITDRYGRYIGLGGRYIKSSSNNVADIPKYINPTECELYNKSTVLFGLLQASKAIHELGYAIVTEGYMDVISPHRIGATNVVGTCGTAFTDQQMKLVKRYTNRLVMMRDNDDAGITSTNQSIPELLKRGFVVEVMEYNKKDPDEWVKSLDTYNNTGGWEFPKITDAVIWRAKKLWHGVNGIIYERAERKKIILELVSKVQDEILRNHYFDTICTEFDWRHGDTKKEFASIIESSVTVDEEAAGAIKLPEWMTKEQQEEFLKNGYVPVNRRVNGKPIVGYFSFTSAGKVEITNFIINPLFHVYAGVESRYLLQIYNGYRHAVLDIPARVIPSIEQFQAFTVSEGNYMIFGSKPQWLRIASELLNKFPRCIELTSLGWQRFSFFAWVDKAYIPGEGVKDLNNWGIVEYKKESFLIPASCEAYRQLQRTGDDPFENDRYLTYKLSPVKFGRWAEQMQKVYLQKGLVAVAYAILTIFRDLIFEIDHNCPHLYAFGEPSSGKSKWAESITAIFYYKRSAFNLNSGTDFAFFNYLQRYKNCPAHLNELDIEVLRPEWFQAIKGVYDGEGRERGKNGSRSKTEVMHVNSTIILTGQKLITADDNALVSRCLIEGFSIREDLTEEQKKAYNTLKGWENEGMSSMLEELLDLRPIMEEYYKSDLNNLLKYWRKEKKEGAQLNQRILQNYAHLATCYNLVNKYIPMPQSDEEFTEYCYEQAKRWSNFIRSSDSLSEFWRTFEFLVNQQQAVENWDFLIEECASIRIRKSREEETLINFDLPTKILFVRLNNIHKLFQSIYRNRTGREAISLDNLLHYFSSRKYFLGWVKQKRFRRYRINSEKISGKDLLGQNISNIETRKEEQMQKTSCYAFLYDDLGIEIESSIGLNEEEKNEIFNPDE